MIEQVLDIFDRHLLVLLQIEQHARVDLPHRVPITSPSSGVSPIVVSTLRPSRKAHRLAPLPRCAIIVRFATNCGAIRASAPRDIFEREAVKSVAPDTALFIAPRNGEAAGGGAMP